MAKKKNKSKAATKLTYGSERCPYCGSRITLRSADGIYKVNNDNAELYVCSRYPECDAYVRVHPGTKKPVGTLANHKLRKLRSTAHRYFDQLYSSGLMSKDQAYDWLASILFMPRSQAHIGYLGEYYCELVISESKKYLEQRRNLKSCLMTGGRTV